MQIDIDRLRDDAYVWVFGVSPALGEQQQQRLLSRVGAFLADWTAHGVPIPAAGEIREGAFLLVAANEDREKSGCSIDRLYGTLRELERELDVRILDPNRVFYRANGAVRSVRRSEFRNVADAATPVFDTTVERLGSIRSGEWERPAAASWHRQLLPAQAQWP